MMSHATPSPTTLPALGQQSAISSEKDAWCTGATSPMPPPSSSAAAPAAGVAVDFVALYRQYCAEEGCKANSAFVRYMQDRGGRFSLERLHLGNNYLGAKGLRPVLRMIDLCQTIVSINLENNGIDNAAIADLCDVLERHVSISSLNLRHNPISVVGGKRLLHLVETNPRMTEILLDGTDVFGALQERIQTTLQHNSAISENAGPQLEANRDDASAGATAARTTPPAGSTAAAHGAATVSGRGRAPRLTAQTVGSTTPPKKATLQPLPPLGVTMSSHMSSQTRVSAMAAGDAMTYAGTQTCAAAANIPGATPADQYDGSRSASSTRLSWQEAALGKPQPRPPAPSAISAAGGTNAPTSKALPVSKVRDLKALFAERARLHTEVNRGEASRRAYAAREELLALQRCGRPSGGDTASTTTAVSAGDKQGVHQTYPSSRTSSTGSHGGVVADRMAHTSDAPLTLPIPPLRSRSVDEGSDTSITSLNRTNAPEPVARSPMHPSSQTVQERHSGTPQRALAAGRLAENSSAPSKQDAARDALEAAPGTRPQAHTVEDVLSPSRMMLLTTEEQFTVLFDQGCREYMNRNLDAAYMAWNEAMRLAVSENQREWMAVVANNLQRLSYELLVEEGAGHLERGELEKAGDAFKLAFDVAVKAQNAAWERDMRLAKQNVQKALFHRFHEAALLLFNRAQEDARGGDAATEVTEDDYFVLPGTEEMVRHTPAFVREWACLLLLKEAVGLWAESVRVVAKLSEAAAAPLRENIVEALNLVASFIAQQHYNSTAPAGLLWFHTDAYLYHECVLLSDLWYDLVADSEQSLRHPLLSAVCAAQLGELYVATFQLPQALVQLTKMSKYGNANNVPVLEATALTLCGRVHLQRANYALAESALEQALELWTAIQVDPAMKKLLDHTSEAPLPEMALLDPVAATAEMTGVASPKSNGAGAGAAAAAPTGGIGGSSLTSSIGQPSMTSPLRPGGAHGAHSSTLRFRIEAHLPPDAVAVLANECRQYKVSLLLQTYRYRAALETLEYSLNVAYSDTLEEKLGRNYHLRPSVDEIAAIAGVLRTSLVFYSLTSRYDWTTKRNAYLAEESLCIWVMADSHEMRFVEVNLTKDFKCTIVELLDNLRQRLCVEPEVTMQPEIITALPSRTWQEPLRVLYQACISPIIGYIRASDPHLLSGDGVITVVPAGLLWLVPFHALLNVKAADRYLVEEVAVQLAFSATQAAFAALSAERVQQRDVSREVVAVQTDGVRGMVDASSFYTAFPVNTDRSMKEGQAVAAMLRAGQANLAARELTALTHKVDLIEDAEALRMVLPRARTLHIATATTASVPPVNATVASLRQGGADWHARRTGGGLHTAVTVGGAFSGNEGGLLLGDASSMGDAGVVWASDIARMELVAEHVILTSTNVSRHHAGGIRDAVLGLVRGFLGSGVPCVLCGQWCTPDMEPLELFRRFYALWCPAAAPGSGSGAAFDASSRGSKLSSPTGSGTSRSGETSAEGIAEIVGTDAGSTEPKEVLESGENIRHRATRDGEGEGDGEVVRHRALLLARAIRRLLAEESSMRYRPRLWAGYYCVGTGW